MTTRPLPSASLAGARQAASGGWSVGPTHTQRATAAQDPARERPIQVEVVDDRGFSWADAGIDALAAVGVVLSPQEPGLRFAVRRSRGDGTNTHTAMKEAHMHTDHGGGSPS